MIEGVFWLLWLGVIAILASALTTVYAWKGREIGIVKKKKANRLWKISKTIFTVGIILGGYAFLNLLGARIENGLPKNLSGFWLTTLITLMGFTLTTKKMARKNSNEKKWFYVSFILLGIGFLGIAWLTYPENLLIGDKII